MGLLGFSTSNARDAPRSLRYSELRKRGCRTARSGQGSIRRSARRRAFIRAVRNALSQGGTLRRSAVFNAVENLPNEAPRQAAAGGPLIKEGPASTGLVSMKEISTVPSKTRSVEKTMRAEPRATDSPAEMAARQRDISVHEL